MILPLSLRSILQLGFIYNNRWWYLWGIACFFIREGQLHTSAGRRNKTFSQHHFLAPCLTIKQEEFVAKGHPAIISS